MIAYLDTSVVLRHVLEGDKSIQQALMHENLVTSELLWLECCRVLERHRLIGNIDDQNLVLARQRCRKVYDGLGRIHVTSSVLARAAQSFPTVLGTLDAIHLASAIIWTQKKEQELIVYSFDKQLNTCALALGFEAPLHSL